MLLHMSINTKVFLHEELFSSVMSNGKSVDKWLVLFERQVFLKCQYLVQEVLWKHWNLNIYSQELQSQFPAWELIV